MPEVYSITTFANGIKYAVFFFGSFSGHFHPWTPIHPLHVDEIGKIGLAKYGKSVYYQGWYSDTPKGPRLDKLLKYELFRGPIKVDIPLLKQPGVYYHHIEKVGGVWKIREPLSSEAVVSQENYFRYVINKNGEVEFAYRVYATLMWSYTYIYKSDGALEKVIPKINDITENIPD